MDLAAEPRTPRTVSRTAGWLFAFLCGVYVLVGGGHIYSPDGVVMYRVARSLLEHGTAEIEPLANWPSFGGSLYYEAPGARPRFYAKYGLGQSLAAMPGLVAGHLLAPLAGSQERGLFDTPFGPDPHPDPAAPFAHGNPFRLRWDDWSAAAWPGPLLAWTASWTNAWVVAASASVLFLLGCELGFGLRPALAMALLAGLATPLAVYARSFFAEPLAGLALVSFLLLLVRAMRRERGSPWLFAAGLALGVCVLAKIAHVVLLGPAVLLVAVLVRRRERFFPGRATARARLAAAATFGAGLALPLLAIAAYDLLRFGSPFETGYAGEVQQWTTPFLEGFSGLLVSPGRGLVWFAPIVLAGLVRGRRFAARYPWEAAFVGLSLLALLCTYARWYMWEGGWCFGPRFLVPVLPLLMLPVGFLLREMPRSRAVRGGFLLLVVVSFGVVLSGLVVNTMDFHQWVKLTYGFRAAEFAASGATGYYDLVRWDWRFSPLVASWTFPVKDAFLLPHALRTPGLVLSLLGAFAALATLSAWRLAAVVRPTAPEHDLTGSEASAAP